MDRYEDSILRSLRRTSRAIDRHSKGLAKHHSLTLPQLVCLREIVRADGATPSQVARAVSLSQATVTGIIDRLEARSMVTRERSEEDRRKVYVRATPRGEELANDAPSPLHEELARRLAALHEGERALIDWVLQRVVTLLEAEDLDAAPMLMTGPATANARYVADLLDPTPPPGPLAAPPPREPPVPQTIRRRNKKATRSA
ncbi:MAG: MarR family winged helix-turn-helix transcriptional regulator [Sandaracinaceae bacterium]